MIHPTMLLAAKNKIVNAVVDFILNVLDEVKNVPINHSSLVASLGKRIGSQAKAQQILDELKDGQYSRILDWQINYDLSTMERKVRNWVLEMI